MRRSRPRARGAAGSALSPRLSKTGRPCSSSISSRPSCWPAGSSASSKPPLAAWSMSARLPAQFASPRGLGLRDVQGSACRAHREMAADFAPRGVRANAISPGEIDTSILSTGTETIVAGIPMGRRARRRKWPRPSIFSAPSGRATSTGPSCTSMAASTSRRKKEPAGKGRARGRWERGEEDGLKRSSRRRGELATGDREDVDRSKRGAGGGGGQWLVGGGREPDRGHADKDCSQSAARKRIRKRVFLSSCGSWRKSFDLVSR